MHAALPPDGLEAEFEKLVRSTDMMVRVRSMDSDLVSHLARYGQFRMEEGIREGEAEIEMELQVCARGIA